MPRLCCWATSLGLAVGFFASSPQAALAQQALSKSLAQCHVITDVVVQAATPEQQQLDLVKFFADASRVFHQEALKQAQREGLSDVTNYVTRMEAEAKAYWAPKLQDPSASGEYGDWIEYCTALGDELKLPLDAPN